MKERDEKKQFLLLAKDAECSRNFGTNFKSAFTVESADDWEVKLFPFEKCFKKGRENGKTDRTGPDKREGSDRVRLDDFKRR